MNLTITTQPAAEPVTLSEVYAQLRLDTEGSPPEHAHDSLLQSLIATARQEVESMSRRSLVVRPVRLSMPGFPAVDVTSTTDAERRYLVSEIRLHRPPIVRVDSVRYYDSDNALQTVDPASYYVTDEQVPALRFVSGFSAPAVYDRPDAVRVDYVAGYLGEGSPPTTQAELAANVPEQLKQAILVGVELLYDAKTPQERQAIERLRESLVQPLRIQLTP